MRKLLKRIAVALENIYMQLRRRNDQAEAFYREALQVLTQAKGDEGPPRPVPTDADTAYGVPPDGGA